MAQLKALINNLIIVSEDFRKKQLFPLGIGLAKASRDTRDDCAESVSLGASLDGLRSGSDCLKGGTASEHVHLL